ncbi:MAG: formylmethanofuran dehydrogenase subunit E family protein [Acidobacteriia bacterium]|nr:formylmethanofuran dehydrogenase subunit E family protein [Terriglobia bacterium]
MKTFDEYVAIAGKAHGHICAGQILGLRLAVYGMKLLGLDDPAGTQRKRLVTYVEIDRCATDAVTVVTGCRLGKRSLKFRDFGKVAATFCDLQEKRAVRVVALETSKQKAREMYPEIADRNQQQMKAYREMPETDLFTHTWVRVRVGPEDLPGYKAPRVSCDICGEGISFGKEVTWEGLELFMKQRKTELPSAQVSPELLECLKARTAPFALCRACAGERYWEPCD